MSSLESCKTYICETLFNFLLSKEEINEKFDLISYVEQNSIYVKHKCNEKDGYIFTSLPYMDNNEIVFHVGIIPVDSSKMPKTCLMKTVLPDETNNQHILNYLMAWEIAV